MKSKVNIIVSGGVGSGKTTVCEIIANALREHGIEVNFDAMEILDQNRVATYKDKLRETMRDKLIVSIKSATINRTASYRKNSF